MMRDVMRGDVGESILEYMLETVPRGKRRVPAGREPMWQRTKIYDFGDSGGVEIGYRGEDVVNAAVQGARFQLGTWIESGTFRHTIRPKTARVLHWEEGGQHFFSHGHSVRGIKKRLIALQALGANESRIIDAMERQIAKYFKPQGLIV